MLVNVDVEVVARRLGVALAPQVSLAKTNHVQRLARKSIQTIRQLLRVAKLTVDAFDPAELAAHVGWSPHVTELLGGSDAHAVPGPERAHETPQVSSRSAIRASISSRLRIPFS